MKRTEFDAQYKSKRIKFSLREIPTGDNLFYGCNLCEDVLPSSPAQSESCSCGNLFIDVKLGGVAIESGFDGVSVLEVSK